MGLYYHGARYYDPTIGRFISPDTVVPSEMNPQTLNRYSYVINNPLKYGDPSGRFLVMEDGGGSARIDDPATPEVIHVTSGLILLSAWAFELPAGPEGDADISVGWQEQGASLLLDAEILAMNFNPNLERDYVAFQAIPIDATMTYYPQTGIGEFSLIVENSAPRSFLYDPKIVAGDETARMKEAPSMYPVPYPPPSLRSQGAPLDLPFSTTYTRTVANMDAPTQLSSLSIDLGEYRALRIPSVLHSPYVAVDFKRGTVVLR